MALFFENIKPFLEEFLAKFAELIVELVVELIVSILNLVALIPQLEATGELYTLIVRWVFPILAITIFLRCISPLRQNRRGDTVWGYLALANGIRIPITSWENLIGRGKYSDLVINIPFISRSHAVLTRHNRTWSIADLGSKGGVEVNGSKIEKQETVNNGDTISLAGLEMVLISAEDEPFEQPPETAASNSPGGQGSSSSTLFLIILFQVLGAIQICFAQEAALNSVVPVTFFLFILAECLHYNLMQRLSRKSFALELLCYFLCGLNLLIVASADPGDLFKQLIAILIGLTAYTVIEVTIRNLGRAKKLKYLFMAGGLALLVLNLAIGETHFGAKNWVNLGFITFQPMEFVKIAFVLAGTATLDRLLTTRNMTAFIGFSGACIITLVLISDFGTALIFFGAFIVIAFMHSGDIRTLFLITAAAAFGGLAALSFRPYIAARFTTWGKAWQFADSSGYQQTRTMIAAASGGLFGVGGGNGYLVDVAAADTDLVFGMLCEEWGLIVAFTAVLALLFLAIRAVILTKNCRSSFYAIAACGAAAIFLLQTALNVLGSVDLLPFTGVTIPFISNGGSSMIASWGLLALIKSAE